MEQNSAGNTQLIYTFIEKCISFSTVNEQNHALGLKGGKPHSGL